MSEVKSEEIFQATQKSMAAQQDPTVWDTVFAAAHWA